jgi:hypothetical protein
MNKDWYRALLRALIVGILLLQWAVLCGMPFSPIKSRAMSPIKSVPRASRSIRNRRQKRWGLSVSEALRALDHNRDIATIVGGTGLILVAVGWLAHDFVRARAKREKLVT